MRQVKFFVSIFVVAFVSCYLGGALRFVFASSDIKNTITGSAEKVGSFVYDFVGENLAFGSFEEYVLNNTADISETELAQLSFRENAEDVAIYTYRTISGWFARKETVIVKEVPVEIPTQPTAVVSTTTQPLPQVITRTVQTVVSPVREVVKETIVERLVSGISSADLQALENKLRAEIYRVADNATTQSNNNYQAIALTNKIDNLSGVTITGATITNSTISGTTGSFSSSISGSSLTLTGGLTATTGGFSGNITTSGQLVVNGTATSTITGDVAFDSDTLFIDSVNNRVGVGTSSPTDTFSVNGHIYLGPVSSAPSTTKGRIYNLSDNLYWNGTLLGGPAVGAWLTSGSDIYYNTGNVGIGSTSPFKKLSVNGDGWFDGSVTASTITATTTISSPYFTSTNATATSTFAWLSTTRSNLGTIIGGIWNGTSISDSFVDDNITASNYLSLSGWFATTTDGLAEGLTNQYWTNSKFDTRLSATTTLPNLTTLSNLATVGTIGSGTWNGSVIGTQYGGTGQNFSSSSGLIYLTAGTASATTSLSSAYIEDKYLRNDGDDTTTGQLTATNFIGSSAATSTLVGGLRTSGSLDIGGDYRINGVNITTSNIAEGSNLYYRQDRFDSAFALKNLNDLYDVSTSTVSANQLLGWNGTNWTNIDSATVGVSSAASTLFLENSISDLAGYSLLSNTPTTTAETNTTAIVDGGAGTYKAIEEYATNSGIPAVTIINGGTWHFVTFAKVDDATGISNIIYDVYKRTSGGAETLLFTATSTEVNNTSVAEHEDDFVFGDFTLNSTDRLVVKYKAYSDTNNITFTLYLQGSSNYSHIHTPIASSHNSLYGLQGGSASEYYHLTNSEYSELNSWLPSVTLNSSLTSLGNATTSALTITGNAWLATVGGNVGIGTTTPNFKLDVDGIVNATALYVNGAPYVGSQWTTNGSDIYYNTGNVGIGSTTPFAKLSVAGSGWFDDSLTANTVTSSYFTATSTTAASTFAGGLNVHSNTLLVDHSTNRVGVGTASPTQKLDVAGFINTDQYSGYKQAGNTILYASSTNRSTLAGVGAGSSLLAGGLDNTAVGYQALNSGTTGDYNSALGSQSLYTNTTGYDNTSNGYQALYSNTSGYDNTANGYASLYANTTGYDNTANGSAALRANTTGFGNTADGFLALRNNTTGSNNIAFGYNAGRFQANGSTSLTDPENSVYLGVGTRGFSNTDDNTIVIGYNAIGLGANTVVLGNDSITTTALRGNVGVGTTSPFAKLSVNGDGWFDGNVTASSFIATSTTATSTFAGGLIVGTNKLVVDYSTGNIGIGTTSSVSKMTITNTGATASLTIDDEDGDTTPFIVGASGSVIIGATAALGKLSVVGGTFVNADTVADNSFYVDPTQEAVVVQASNVANTLTKPLVLQRWGSSLGIGVSASAPTHLIELDADTYGTTAGWTDASDRNKKENFTDLSDITMSQVKLGTWTGNGSTIDAVEYDEGVVTLDDNGLLARLSVMPVTQWNFINDGDYNEMGDTEIKHIGPTAQDFYKMFGLGASDTRVKATDLAGVALAGIKSMLNIINMKDGAPNSVTIDSNGNVGIGTSTPWRKLSVNGSVAFTNLTNNGTGYYACVNAGTGELATSTTACGASSIRYKENINDLGYGLDTVMQLRPVSFDWKKDFIANGTKQIGFIAEEVSALIPEVIGHDNDGQIMNLDYPKLTSVLVNAVKELNQKVSDISLASEEMVNAVLSRFEELGVRITAGVAYFKDVVVERMTADNVSTNSLEMKDEITGEIYCVKISNGEWVKRMGTCDVQNSNTNTNTNTNIDTEAPVIIINGNNPAMIELGASYVDLGALVTDNIDQNLGITTEGVENVNTEVEGVYIITYSATDQAGNTVSVQRIVIVGNPNAVTNIETEDEAVAEIPEEITEPTEVSDTETDPAETTSETNQTLESVIPDGESWF